MKRIFAIFDCPDTADEVGVMMKVNEALTSTGCTLVECGTNEALRKNMMRRVTGCCKGVAVPPRYERIEVNKDDLKTE